MTGQKRIRLRKKAAFLRAYRNTGTVYRASINADVSNKCHYNWIKQEGPEGDAYRKAFAEATEYVSQMMEDEAYRRAVEGVTEPVFHRGEVCGHIQKFSDVLLMFMLKGVKPEKYRERQSIEHSGGIETKEVKVIIDENWYGNASRLTPQTAESSVAGLVVAGPPENRCLRTPLGKNGNGSNGNGHGSWPTTGHDAGSN